MLKIISWNLAHREESWRFLVCTEADIDLVQEAAFTAASKVPLTLWSRFLPSVQTK
jgi:hypothetical protein